MRGRGFSYFYFQINEHDVRRDGHEAVVNLIRQSKGKPLTLTLGEDNSVRIEIYLFIYLFIYY